MEFWWDSREDFTIQGHEFVDLLLDNLYVQISNHFCTSQGSIQGRVSSHQLHQGLDIRSYVISFLNGPTMWVFYFIHLLIAYQLIIYQSPVSSSIVTLAKNLLHQHIYAKIVSSSWSGTNVWITSMYVVWNVEKCKLTLALPPPPPHGEIHLQRSGNNGAEERKKLMPPGNQIVGVITCDSVPTKICFRRASCKILTIRTKWARINFPLKLFVVKIKDFQWVLWLSKRRMSS